MLKASTYADIAYTQRLLMWPTTASN